MIIVKEKLVADYLDEHRILVDAIISGDPRVEVEVKNSIAEMKTRDPEAVHKRLLEVRADMHRLAAVEKILDTLSKLG